MLFKSCRAELSAKARAASATCRCSGEALEPRTFLSVAFGANVDYGSGTNLRSVTAANFNGNERANLAVTSGIAKLRVLPNTGDGHFAVRAECITGNEPRANTASDLIGDGRPDLAVAISASTTGSVLLNNGDGSDITIESCAFYSGSPHQLRITFSTDVSASLTTSDLVLQNLAIEQTIPAANMSLSYNSTSNTATFTFPGYSNGILPDGDYRAILPEASVTDADGHPFASFSYDFSFFMPAVLSRTFNPNSPQKLQMTFNTNVGASLTASDLILQNLTTGQTVAAENISLSYNTFNNTATFRFPGYSSGILPNGNYRASISAGLVTDASGNPLPAFSYNFSFFMPVVLSCTFDPNSPQMLRMTFNKNVSASLAASDLMLQNLTTGQTVPAANISLSYNTTNNTATFTFPGYSSGILPDGNYRASISAGSITDASGDPVSAFSYDFSFLFGLSVVSSIFDFDASQQQVRMIFNADVSASLSVEDLSIDNLTTGQNVPAENVILSYNPTTNTATFTFPGYAYGALPDGNYRAMLLPGSVTDPMNNSVVFGFDFFALNGDCNRDRVVNINDLGIVGKNYGVTGRPWKNGDFTYDGVVNIIDLGILGQRYKKSLPPPPQAVAISSAAFTQQTSSLNPPPPPVRSTTRMPVRVVTFIQDI